jgi:uncharacterized membrane protein (DUF485 family)
MSVAKKIQLDPNFHALVLKRNILAWTLSLVVIVLYFGFILMIAFAPDFLTQPISDTSVIPVGMLFGVGVIGISVLTTGIYVHQANTIFDPANNAIIEGANK